MVKTPLTAVAALRSALRTSTGAASGLCSRTAALASLGGRHGGGVRTASTLTLTPLGGSRSDAVSSAARPSASVAAPAAGYHASATAAAPGAASGAPPSVVTAADGTTHRLAPPAARRAAVLEAVRDQATAHSDAFYVVDLGEIARKFAQWRSELPRARPYYAVKCNDDPRIVATLAALGAGFDCASKGEMEMVTGVGVPARDIIFAHPAKQSSHIAYAKAVGVTRMTFDNEDELRKIAREYPGAEVVLRILTDDSASVCRLGLKFGCPLSEAPRLMALAKELGVTVRGVSYHVGSGNGKASSFGDAVRDARTAFDIARAAGHAPTLLDIGGGFPGSELGAEKTGSDRLVASAAEAAASTGGNPYSKHPSFASIAAVVRAALDEYFPPGCGVDIIAEPGRYFVKSSHVLAVNVIGKRATVDEATGGKRLNYYVNEGLYGSFNCILYDHVTCEPSLLLTTRPAVATAPIAAVEEALASAADDSIARVDEHGNVVCEDDVVGFGHAAHLAEAVAGIKAAAAAAAAEEEDAESLSTLHRRTMMLGGEAAADIAEAVSMAAGSSIVSAASAAFGTGSSGSRATLSAPRAASPSGLAFHALGGGARHASSSATAAAAAPAAAASASRYPTTLWGNTCDSIDKITDEATLPELHLGDWLVFENMGAYTIAGSCRFNGFPISTKVYMNIDGSLDVVRAS